MDSVNILITINSPGTEKCFRLISRRILINQQQEVAEFEQEVAEFHYAFLSMCLSEKSL